MPAISIIMPAYNAEKFIGRAIASVRAQTEADWELLAIDDCSSDRTALLIEAASRADPRVRLIRMPHNGGPAAARNAGLEAARGAAITLLDADDRYHPDRLRTLRDLAWNTGADMVADNLLLCPLGREEDGQPMIPADLLPVPASVTSTEFFVRNSGDRGHPRVSYGFVKPLFKTDFLHAHGLRYDERNRFGEDFLLYASCLICGASLWLTPEPLYFYTIVPGSLTEVQTADDLARISALDAELLARPEVTKDPALVRAIRLHKRKVDRSYYYRAFTDALKQRQFGAAARLAFGNLEGLELIARESMTQLPAIVMKAARGGYRSAPPRR